jgi:hypothetical protein
VNLSESRYLAQRLLNCEAAERKNSETTESAAFRVCAKLRGPLITIAGVTGFRSLLSRALTLARVKAPSLDAVQIAEDGSLQGLDELEPQIDKDQTGEGPTILIAELIGLLLTFIGKGLTLHMVQSVWPQAAEGNLISEKERRLEHKGQSYNKQTSDRDPRPR